jgi:cystathionine beta-lyase/cystathionine gamma-synthase
MYSNFCLAQNIDSTNAPVSMSMAIDIAKKKGCYIATNETVLPAVTFDVFLKQWKIVSTSYSHSIKGECKHTNGCTVVTKKSIWIDATKGKVKKKNKEVESFFNYE